MRVINKLLIKTLFISLFTLLVFQVTIYAQTPTQTVKGRVVDIDSEMPIIGATIMLIGSNPIIGTVTDLDGRYKFISIPIGRQSFKISFNTYGIEYTSQSRKKAPKPKNKRSE